MSDPSFLVSNPSQTDPKLAPEGRSSYYILFPTPNARADIDWAEIGPRYRDEVLNTMQRRGFDDFAGSIEVEAMVTPADWQAQGLAAGAPFAAAHTFGQSGPFRFPTLDRRVPNLVFCGSNTQPGVGVPMVLLSGQLAAARITGMPSDDRPAGPGRTGGGRASPIRSCRRATCGPGCSMLSTARPITWPRCCCRRPSGPTCTRSTASPASPTTSSTTSIRSCRQDARSIEFRRWSRRVPGRSGDAGVPPTR